MAGSSIPSQTAGPLSGQPPPRKRILVADDDPAISRLLERILGQEFDVYTASDGRAALTLAGQINPHLLVLDVMMPALDGFAVAAQVRLVPHLKNVPIIFLTARDNALDTIKGIQAGARHYITKPFKIDDVTSKVRKTLNP